ncbi:hypothetical protein [Brumimicrobium mesophilum]|uniref:hypothetical protein n=1 Tax=Brumimicrobium mesophilum TaxID=392717 RepID=UPI00131B89C3|nr:hypothetical protein [Brumimicrobium mesophilum]
MKWLLHILCVLSVSFSFGQKLNINLDKEEVQIGEPFKLTLSVISDKKFDSLVYIPKEEVFSGKNSVNSNSDEISEDYGLEITKAFKDTTYKEGKEFIWKGSYELIAWDSAYVVIPPEMILIQDSLYLFPAGLISVMSPPANPTQPIYDINENFTDLPDKSAIEKFISQYWPWVVIGLILFIGIGIYLFKRSRKEEIPLTLRESTLLQIDELERSKAYEIDLKEYYFDLSMILRRFFAAHYQIRILDKTTLEIESILEENGLDDEMILLTRQLLVQSDLVKFAKSVPGIKEIQDVTNDARRVVNEIADIDFNNE